MNGLWVSALDFSISKRTTKGSSKKISMNFLIYFKISKTPETSGVIVEKSHLLQKKHLQNMNAFFHSARTLSSATKTTFSPQRKKLK